MRSIKFRAWDKKNRKMLHNLHPKSMQSSLYRCISSGFAAMYDPQYEWLDVELMQFTGMKDKGGHEIYEGDIVEYTDICDLSYITTRGVINWIENRCQFMPQDIQKNTKGGHYVTHWDTTEGLVIIGNIHENPELLVEARKDTG